MCLLLLLEGSQTFTYGLSRWAGKARTSDTAAAARCHDPHQHHLHRPHHQPRQYLKRCDNTGVHKCAGPGEFWEIAGGHRRYVCPEGLRLLAAVQRLTSSGGREEGRSPTSRGAAGPPEAHERAVSPTFGEPEGWGGVLQNGRFWKSREGWGHVAGPEWGVESRSP